MATAIAQNVAAAPGSPSASSPGGMGNPEWPPSLKAMVASAFAQCEDPSQKAAVQAELKTRIFEAYRDGKLASTDWANFKLESLQPKPSAKRKKSQITRISSTLYDKTAAGGKASASGIASTSTLPNVGEEMDARQKRLRRFENDSPGANSPYAAGPLAVLKKPNQAKGKGRAGGLEALSLQEPRAMYGSSDPVFNPDVIEWDAQTIVGTSRQLEKPYLRLTSAPDPKTVRPLPVLKQTLEHLKKKWRAESNYAWVCDQFKSLRQDLTVQRIKNDFTVMAYEIHARIALEKGDLGEYNQCQSQLRELYKHGLEGHPMEFLAYRVLYLVHTRNRSDFSALLASLTPEQRADPGVQHALDVRSSLATSNYHRFFKLFLTAPKMGPYMIDHFVERERVAALVVMSKAYKTLPLAYITDELAFDSTEAAHAFLLKWRAATYAPLPPQPVLPAQPISISLSKPSKLAKPSHPPSKMSIDGRREQDEPAEQRQLDCKLAQPHLLAAAQTFSKVDIKGQI